MNRRWLRHPLTYAIEKRRGIPQARNAALARVLGEVDWIAFVDDDEVFALTARLRGDRIRYNRETKLRPGGADAYPEPEVFVAAIRLTLRVSRVPGASRPVRT